jgi:hypothetical protein
MNIDEIEDSLDEKLEQLKTDYMTMQINLQVYREYLKKYLYIVNESGEGLISQYIQDNIILVANDDRKADKEWRDYYMAYISGLPYDFEIVNGPAIADLVQRRMVSLELRMKEENLDYKAAFEKEKKYYNKSYKTDKEMSMLIGRSYKTVSDKIIDDAIEYLKSYANYLTQFSLYDPDEFRQEIYRIFDKNDLEFRSLFLNPSLLVLVEIPNGIILSPPNLVMAAVPLVIKRTSMM